MTVDTIDANSPTVFDAGLPAIAYEHAHNPEEAHRLIRQARLQGRLRWGRTGSCQWRCHNRRTPTRTCRTARHPISKRATTF
jgi:hypothetical protein